MSGWMTLGLISWVAITALLAISVVRLLAEHKHLKMYLNGYYRQFRIYQQQIRMLQRGHRRKNRLINRLRKEKQ